MENPDSSNGDLEKPIKDDRFSETISLDEKVTLLNGAPSFITKAIAETVHNINNPDDQKLILAKIHHFNSGADMTHGLVGEFMDYVKTGKNESLTPFLGSVNSQYLSIMCGFIEGVRNLRAGGKIDVVGAITGDFETNVKKSLATTPEKSKGQSAAFIIKYRFADEPTI
jgi:predicted nucleic acid-binding Zn finger protein